jgi:hypothetical protein
LVCQGLSPGDKDQFIVIVIESMDEGDTLASKLAQRTVYPQDVCVEVFSIRSGHPGHVSIVDRVDKTVRWMLASQWTIDNHVDQLAEILSGKR